MYTQTDVLIKSLPGLIVLIGVIFLMYRLRKSKKENPPKVIEDNREAVKMLKRITTYSVCGVIISIIGLIALKFYLVNLNGSLVRFSAPLVALLGISVFFLVRVKNAKLLFNENDIVILHWFNKPQFIKWQEITKVEKVSVSGNKFKLKIITDSTVGYVSNDTLAFDLFLGLMKQKLDPSIVEI